MIVISHPWEFIPKGSSHLNYYSNGGSMNAKSDAKVIDPTTDNIITTNENANNKLASTSSNTNVQPPQFYLQKSHASNKTSSNKKSNQFNHEDSSLSEISFAYLHKSPLYIKNINFETTNEKWHLKQINEYCENEIFIKDNKVILSYGIDNESKIIYRTFSYDADIFDCNWFNFKTDSREDGLIKDCLCIFEVQKIHVYFPNGSDFHVQLPFKLKNCWKLRDGILLERQLDYNVNSFSQFRPLEPTQLLFTLSNPLDELKPILCRTSSNEKISFRDSTKQIIVDVIESLNLILVFSLLNNVHYIYRITDFVSEDSQVVNNLLNGTVINNAASSADKFESLNLNVKNNNQVTPMHRQVDSANCLSTNLNHSKKRLSVSPIISTHSFYNKLNFNSPLACPNYQQDKNSTFSLNQANNVNQNANVNSLNSINNVPTTSAQITASQHFIHRNFSPMATLSRSPSCSSSPALMNSVRRGTVGNFNKATVASANQLSIGSSATVSSGSAAAANRFNLLAQTVASSNPNTYHTSTSNQSNMFMTPSIELNNQPYSNQFKTPLNNQMHNQLTPMNIYRRNFTPQMMNTSIMSCLDNNVNFSGPMYEQATPEYTFEMIWTEPAMVAGDSTYNEKATKFFYINDLYNQKYVCYLMPAKNQLRCLRIDYNQEADLTSLVGSINYIPAKDATFVESRNLMIVIDNQGSLLVYSGLVKLCKLQLHNIVWSKHSFVLNKPCRDVYQSPIVTPVKSKLFLNNSTTKAEEMNVDEHLKMSNQLKTPKQSNKECLMSKALMNSTTNMAISGAIPTILQQQEYKSLGDATGCHFNIKLKDNRLVRVKLNESSTCELVNICLDAFKFTLSKEIYYEIIQQWYIHRYSIGGETIKDQLSLFLYLLLNLCGCFDMNRLEHDLPFLSFNNLSGKTNIANKSKRPTQHDVAEESQLTGEQTTQDTNTDSNAKRAKCFADKKSSNDDWEFLMNDELIHRANEIDKSFREFGSLGAKKSSNIKQFDSVRDYLDPIDSVKSSNQTLVFGSRQKRPISSINASSSSIISTATSSGIGQSINSNSGGGILYPFLKNILYTMHLIYEECKLYKSLAIYGETLIQVLYILANELNLPAYTTYYEQECPFLLKLKCVKLSTGNQTLLSSSSSSSYLPSKNSQGSYLNHLINQEPPVLNKFLLELIENKQSGNDYNQSSIINPFPIISTVTKRTVKAIKIYALIAICTNSRFKNINYDELVNQLFFKINFTGFQSQKSASESGSTSSPQPQTADKTMQQLNSSLHNQQQPNYTLKFSYKPGEHFIYENIFSLCLEMGVCTLNKIYDYPFSVLFPILESINWSRENPCFSWPSYAFDLIGRNDLSILKANSSSMIAEASLLSQLNSEQNDEGENAARCGDNEGSSKTVINKRVGSTMTRRSRPTTRPGIDEDSLTLNIVQNSKKEDEDGMQHVFELEALKCRFNEDLRIKEVRTCLQTTRPIQIKLNQGPDVSDHDFLEEEEKFLSFICMRTMSLPVGRGIFTLHTVNPIPTEPVLIPELNLKGKSVTKKTTIDLTRIEVPANMTYWPSFHNGVATGLTINSQAKDLSNSWIKSHLAKNFELTNEQAGFLYGLGLTGHLANFSMLNIHDALTRRHDLTNIAILLGLAASKIGSMDLSVTRLISMHIKSLMPPVEIELEIPYNIQIAALLSLGLVYVKSANKHISYVLLKEIGRLPGNEVDKDLHSLDREAYSLTAGLSLGLILLEKGKKSLTIMDSSFTDVLYHYMVGGHKEKYADNGALAANTCSQATTAGVSNENNISGTNNYSNNFRNNNNSYIREGESINTNVTCPGATLALGLIYFNSCDKLIAEWFSPPDSAFLLDSIRPDFLLLRTVARNLIMWKHILPTQNWLLGQLSNLLKTTVKSDKQLSEKFSHLINIETKPSSKLSKVGKSEKLSRNKENMVEISKQSNKQVRLVVQSAAASYDDSDEPLKSQIKELDSDLDDDGEEEDEDESDLTDELKDDTDDEDNIIVIQKQIKYKKLISKRRKKVSGKSLGSVKKHLLSDLISFDSVDDDLSLDNEQELLKKTKPTLKIENANSEDYDNDFEYLSANMDSNSNSSETQTNLIDDETKVEAFRHIVAGACMSIGLKFAGTFNNDAYQTLLFWAKYFTDLNDSKLSTENCLCVIVISLSMVMAGSGDLEVLRICRYLRSRVGPNYLHVTYGSQMAVNIALALLFIGGGKYTLKTDSLSVALMLCAFYPHFPVDGNDNRFHLQAFRHLYVLASEPRLLLPRDVDTNEFCTVPIEIKLKATEHYDTFVYQQMAPSILPELNKIEELTILGPRYYSIKFKENLHFNDLKNILLSELLVKQKNGYYSYSDDPKDEKAFNIRNFLNKIIVPHKITPELIQQITNEEHINLFANVLNKSTENKFNSKTNHLLKMIYESVVQETFDYVGIMLLLDKEANKEPNSNIIQQMKLVDKFYKSLPTTHGKHIVNMEFLYSAINNLETKLKEKIKYKRELITSYLNDTYETDIEHLINFCVLNNISKLELDLFTKSKSLADLIKNKSSQISIEKMLKLHQLFNSSN